MMVEQRQPDEEHAADGGPRHEADETSGADAGLTGGEGVGSAQPAIAHDDEPGEDV